MKTYNRNNLPPHMVKHSPTGMSWGYGGSGPSDLARSILCDITTELVANRNYQAFKREFVEKWTEGWQITEEEVRAWLDKRKKEVQKL